METQQQNLFEVHRFENNPTSQIRLDADREKLSGKCLTVFNWLMNGMNVTVLWAANNGVSSLPRRIKDLKENGVLISDRWDNNIKAWFMDQDQKQFNHQFRKHGK